MATEPEAAIAMPDHPEPLVTEQTKVGAPYTPRLSRQARRKALRAEAKALRREGRPPAPIAQPAELPTLEPLPVQAMPVPEIETPLELAVISPAPVAAPILAAPIPEPVAAIPLPPARSLVVARPRGLAQIAHRVRGLFGLTRARMVPAGEGTIAAQLRTLRSELAALQQSIDRMIDGVAV